MYYSSPVNCVRIPRDYLNRQLMESKAMSHTCSELYYALRRLIMHAWPSGAEEREDVACRKINVLDYSCRTDTFGTVCPEMD